MANRHLYRSIVLQTLFEWDIRNFASYDVKKSIQYNTSSFLSMSSDVDEDVFIIFEDIKKKRVLIDEIIEKAAPDWTLAKMTIIDRNILRLGMYELLFVDKERVPGKVAINEAVELAKQFGGGKSGRFINGVIGAVYKELGEPGKDFKEKKSKQAIPLEDMEIDQKGSAVVYSIDTHNIIRIGMVHDIFGYWTLAKGGIKEGETAENGTVRAIKEETDWDIILEEKLGENEYIAYPPERGAVRKQVQYFLGKSAYTKPTLEVGTGGLDDIRWFELNEISDLNVYNDVSKMLLKAIKLIMEKHLIQEFDESEKKEEEESEKKEEEKISDSDKKDKIDYSELKVAELRALAKERDLSGFSALKKAELVELLSQ